MEMLRFIFLIRSLVLTDFILILLLFVIQLFNVDEPMSMPMSSYMSSELDAYRNMSDGVVAG